MIFSYLPVYPNNFLCFHCTLRSLGWSRSRGDSDVWFRPYGDDLYEYIGTHTDDLMVVSKEPKFVFEELQKHFKFKTLEEPKYYLGIDYHPCVDANGKDCMELGCHTYVKECLVKVSEILGKKDIGKAKCPMDPKGHPELINDDFLSSKLHGEYQQMIGMGVWLCSIGRFDIAYAISSLSRFSSAPRNGHFDALVRVFQYINKFPDKRLRVDASDPKVQGECE